MPNIDAETPDGIWIDDRFVPFIFGGAPDGVEDDPAVDEPIKAEPAAPAFVPADEYKQNQAIIMQTLSTIQEGMAAMRSAASSPAAAAPAVARISEDDFEQAVAAGDGKIVRAYIRQEKDDLKRDHIDPLSTTGLDSLAGLTREVVLEKLPYYKKYQKEIDGFVAQMPAASRLQPEVLRIAHDAIVGRHVAEIEAETRASALRSRAAEPAESAPARRGRDAGKPADTVPTVADLAGDDGVKALAELGRGGKDADGFARSLGYDSWKDYMKKAEAYV